MQRKGETSASSPDTAAVTVASKAETDGNGGNSSNIAVPDAPPQAVGNSSSSPSASNGAPAVYNPMLLCSSNGKIGFMVVGLVATIVMGWLIVQAHRGNQAVSNYGDLTVGQIGSGIVGIGFVFWWGCFKLLYLRDRYVNGEGENCGRKYLSEEAENWVFAGMEFSLCMFLFYFCDRTNMVEVVKKHYDRDLFWFLWALLMAAAFATYTKAKAPAPRPPSSSANEDKQAILAVKEEQEEKEFHVAHLQRDQTEEWKGWMQIMFLWYHYFNNTEIYNAIRLYIAAYVWMTGFGNFSFYYIKKDFSFQRFCGMQWRLNFMVFWTCAILNNEYMLYYICMLHTTFTVFIYIGLGLYQHLNTTTMGVTIKMGVLFIISAIIWDTPQSLIFDKLWWPFTTIVQYHDPKRPNQSPMHEWYFRSYLDHFIWIFGMIVAFNHPNTEKFLKWMDALPKVHSRMTKCGITILTLIACYIYYVQIFSLPKLEYNKYHAYTSWIPITLFIILRNISSTLRRYHLHLFEWCGKITLETYIAQFHIWMGTVGINGAPKNLLAFLPKEWYLVNFFLATCLTVGVCYRLFQATNALKSFVIPYKVSTQTLRRNCIFVGAAIVGMNVYSFILKELLLSYVGKEVGAAKA